MYNNISNDAKTALKSRIVTTTARITLTSNNQVIDGNNLIDVTITDQCYQDGVIIGTAMCKEVEIELIDNNYDLADKEFTLEVGVLLPNNLYEYIPYGNFIVKEYEKIISSNHYKIIAYDYMDKFNATFIDPNNYDNPITLLSFYQSVAAYYGVSFEYQDNLPNANFILDSKPYFDGMSGRIVLSKIAELMGCFAKINRNNKLEMRLKNNTNEQFSRSEMNNSIERDEMYGPINVVALRLSQVEGENVTKRDEDSIAEYGETTLQIQDNPFVYTQQSRLAAIDDIYDQVDGFSYYPTTFNGKLIYLDTGDEVEVQDMTTDTYYKTIILKQIIKIPSTRSSKFENKALTDVGIAHQFTPEQVVKEKRTEFMVDKQNQIIEGVVNNVSQQNEEIAIIRLQYNELLSRISDIADITTSGESSYANVNLVNINTSQPILIRIHPIIENISYLYPRDNLYPSDTLYMPNRILRFTNTSTYEETEDAVYLSDKDYFSLSGSTYTLLVAGTDYTIGNSISGTIYQHEVFYWELPTDLWYYSDTVYDELELSYGDGTNSTVIVKRKCSIDSTGVISSTGTETTETYSYPTDLVLSDGDYVIDMPGYSTGYLYIQLMAKNIYTTQFYTKAETNTLIEQTTRSIDLSVNQKLSNYSTTSETEARLSLKIDRNENDQIISMINASANKINLTGNRINISSDKFKLLDTGEITVLDGSFQVVNGNNIKVIDISNTGIRYYDSRNLGEIGALVSTQHSGGISKLHLTVFNGEELTISKTSADGSYFTTFMSFSDINSVPFINNTASGTIFSLNPGGGIKIKNGLITEWSLSATTGTVTIENVVMTFHNGLLTGVTTN